MNWLQKTFMLSGADEHYFLVDPVSFYEIKYTRLIPKGTYLYRTLPNVQAVASDSMLAMAKIPPSLIKQNKTTEHFESDIVLKMGQLTTPLDIYQRYIRLDEDLKRKAQSFKDTALSQQFVVANTSLYRITPAGDNAVLECFGPVDDLITKSKELSAMLYNQASKKTGRSYETADARRIDNISTYMANRSLPIDSAKAAFLLRKAGIEPISRSSLEWFKCLVSLDHQAEKLYQDINHFHSMKWVQELLPPHKLIAG